MGTRRLPLIIVIGDGIRHRIWGWRIRCCLCGRVRFLPSIEAYCRFGPDAWVASLSKRLRCKDCKEIYGARELSIDVDLLWPPRRHWRDKRADIQSLGPTPRIVRH